MDTNPQSLQFSLRPATRSEAATIRKIITDANINPLGLNWQRFMLAVDQAGNIIGCGQPSRIRMAHMSWRPSRSCPNVKRGRARTIIFYLLEQHQAGSTSPAGRSSTAVRKFGFESIEENEMTLFPTDHQDGEDFNQSSACPTACL
jgi:hypothetical protein